MPAMRAYFPRWRWFLWIACCAVLMNALAPGISRVLAGQGPDICSITNVGKSDNGKSSKAMMGDCGYCLPHGGSYGLLPHNYSALGLFDTHTLQPFLFYRAPRPLLALTAARPRGPPALA
jgi:hypothetical protein